MTDVAARPRVYLDTNVFIRAFEGSDEEARPIKKLFEALRRDVNRAVTSELTLAEVLAPALSGPSLVNKRHFYFNLIVLPGFIDLLPVTRSILVETADLRKFAAEKSLPDAIHLVTALRAGCAFFMSDDRRIKTPVEMKRVLPDAAGVATILGALNG
jgi:predicted nucleic acid-binding protein